MNLKNVKNQKKIIPFKDLGLENTEYYLKEDLENNFHVILDKKEFNLLRIHRFLFINKKGLFELSTKYTIKANSFPKFNFKTEQITFETSYYRYIIYFDFENFTMNEKARCITFFHDNNIETRFITDDTYLKKILKEFNMTSFYVSDDKNCNVSLDDILSVFEDKNIVQIFQKSEKRILSKDNYEQKFKHGLHIIKDISFNSHIYFKDSCDCQFFYNKYESVIKKIFSFISSKKKILHLFGQRKNGKSVFLNFLPNILHLKEYGSLYLNIAEIKKEKNLKNIKGLIYYELLYLILNQNEVDDLYNLKLFKDILYNNDPIEFLLKFIKNLTEKYDQQKFKADTIVVIIDDIYIYNDDAVSLSLENIINIIIQNDIFKVIICGEGNFFYDKLKKFFFSKNEDNEDYFLLGYFCRDLKELNQNKSKKELIENELTYLNKFSTLNLIYCYDLDGKTVGFLQFIKLNIIRLMPNYLNIEFLENRNKIKFKIANQIFEEALKQKISFCVQSSELKSIMSRTYFPRNVYGISEELLIILLLKFNKFRIKSLEFKKENIIEVEEINKLKSIYLLEKYEGKINNNDNYLILQKKYNGENYDLLIIQSLQNCKNAIFTQIGVDKDKTEILKQKKDLLDNSNNYLNCLEKFFGFKIDYTYLLYIFDEDTQLGLKSPNEISGSKYCMDNNIDYLIYSFNDNTLKKLNSSRCGYHSISDQFYYLDHQIYFNKKSNIK